MTEFEKMRSMQMYDFSDAEILASLVHAKELCAKLQTMALTSPRVREIMRELIPGIPDSSVICPPFHCDHGNGIKVGNDVFLNYDCVILDGAYVTFEDHVKVGPCCKFMTPQHPINYLERRESKETSSPILIGEDAWLGANVTVCPGVRIGRRSIIAAGSVVIRDIPDDCMAAGKPAVVKKHLV